jgi:hypothetical protein
MPDYNIEVADSGGADAAVSWKRYSSETPLEYGAEITIESEDGSRELPVRVVGVDNDAFFTPKATVEPLQAD